MPKKRPWTEEEKAIAHPMRESGKPYREIGEALGRTTDNVARYFARRDHGPARKKGAETIAVMRGLGHGRWEPTVEQLADLDRRRKAQETAPLSVILCGDPVTPRHDSNKDTKPQRASDPFFAWNVLRKRRLVHPLERKRA
jgi:hypothetical protein